MQRIMFCSWQPVWAFGQDQRNGPPTLKELAVRAGRRAVQEHGEALERLSR